MTDSSNAPRRMRWLAEIRRLAVLLLLVIGFHSLVAKPFYIPSGSMMPGLRIGDHLVVSKYPYGWSYASPSFHVLPFLRGRLFGRLPERGDVVIVSRTNGGDSEDLIKRVVGLPGDRVQMVQGRLWLNGRPVATRDLGYRRVPAGTNPRCDDPAQTGREARAPSGGGAAAGGEADCRAQVLVETLPSGRSYEVLDLYRSGVDDTPPYIVPAGHVFLLGDNRDNSADSRVPPELNGLGGAVPLESISGRAEFITYSLKGEATWNPLTWLPDVRWDRAGTSLRPRQEGGPACC